MTLIFCFVLLFFWLYFHFRTEYVNLSHLRNHTTTSTWHFHRGVLYDSVLYVL